MRSFGISTCLHLPLIKSENPQECNHPIKFSRSLLVWVLSKKRNSEKLWNTSGARKPLLASDLFLKRYLNIWFWDLVDSLNHKACTLESGTLRHFKWKAMVNYNTLPSILVFTKSVSSKMANFMAKVKDGSTMTLKLKPRFVYKVTFRMVCLLMDLKFREIKSDLRIKIINGRIKMANCGLSNLPTLMIQQCLFARNGTAIKYWVMEYSGKFKNYRIRRSMSICLGMNTWPKSSIRFFLRALFLGLMINGTSILKLTVKIWFGWQETKVITLIKKLWKMKIWNVSLGYSSITTLLKKVSNNTNIYSVTMQTNLSKLLVQWSKEFN